MASNQGIPACPICGGGNTNTLTLLGCQMIVCHDCGVCGTVAELEAMKPEVDEEWG
jgi:transcription elongation factor Elf1